MVQILNNSKFLKQQAVNTRTLNYSRLSLSHRYEGLVNYITGRYAYAAEIGIGHFPDVAFALLRRGVHVFVTDIRVFQYTGLKAVIDDITEPDLFVYEGVDLLYSLRPPPELVPFMVRLARMLSVDLIVMPLSSEYLGGQLIRYGNTTFFLWKYMEAPSLLGELHL
jgi:uncharacterized UPF0146 family protein